MIQEGRLQDDAMHIGESYRMYRAGADDRGNYGSQVWLSHALSSHVVSTRVVNPRIIAVYLRIADLDLMIVSAHAPTALSDRSDASLFWSALESVLLDHRSDHPMQATLLGIDCNGQVGSLQSESVGLCQPDTETPNGGCLRCISDQVGLKLLNTFCDAGPTWSGNRGHEHRIDFVCASGWLHDSISNVHVSSTIDLATKIRDDNRVLVASLVQAHRLIEDRRSTCDARSDGMDDHVRLFKFEKSSLADPSCQEKFQHHLSQVSFQQVPPSANFASAVSSLDSQVDQLTECVSQASLASFQVQADQPAKKWISDHTWHLIRQANHARSQLRRHRKQQDCVLKSSVFMLWLSVSEVRHRIHTVVSVPLAISIFNSQMPALCMHSLAWHLACFRLVRAKPPSVKRDRIAELERMAAEAESCSSDGKKLYSIVRKLAGTGSKPLAGINGEDGEPLTDKADITASWRHHFTSIFKGEVAESLSDVPKASSLLSAGHLILPLPSSFSPSVSDVCDAIHALRECGVGSDDIAASQLKAGGWIMAEHLHAIISGMIVHGYFPVKWRGGRLVVLHKKGCARSKDNC